MFGLTVLQLHSRVSFVAYAFADLGPVLLVCSVGLALGCGPAVATGEGEDPSSTTSGPSTATSPGTSGMGTAPGTSPTSPPPDPTQPVTTSPTTEPPLTTGASSESGDDTVDDTGPCLFLCEPDGGGGGYECDIFVQDCPRGEKCAPWANDGGSSWNAHRCVPVEEDPDSVGEPCTVEGSGVSGIDSCDDSSMCFGVDDTGTGECFAFCEGNWEEPTCDDGSFCSISGDGALVICVPKCDPTQPDSCDADEVCVPGGLDFACAPATLDSGFLEACEYVNACESGSLCVSSSTLDGCDEATGCCTPFCDLAEPECPDTTACVPYFEEGQAPPGLEEIGFCGNGS